MNATRHRDEIAAPAVNGGGAVLFQDKRKIRVLSNLSSSSKTELGPMAGCP
jgi:2-phospho-L-lactate guanylyltransferase (CobY/MobA/RfbA family)